MSSTHAAHSRVHESALRDLIALVRRRAAVLVIAIVALPAGALGFSLSAEKQYTATAKLLFRDPGFDQKLSGPVLAPSVDPAREAATNIGLVSLETVAERAAAAIKSRPLSAADIRDSVTVAAEGQSNVVAVEATDKSPDFAAYLANTVAQQYILFRREADRSKIDEVARLVDRRLSRLSSKERARREGRELREQLEQLRVLAALQTGNAELVQTAQAPRSPSSPKPLRTALIALLLAIAIGLALALLLDRLDSTLRGREHAEELLASPVLGVIPQSRSLRRDHGDVLHLDGPEAEAFRTLRANLRYYDTDRDIRSLMVTSSAPADGKSTVARCLAASAAGANVRVILVETDLRRPTLNALYPGLHPGGLSEILDGRAALAETIQQLPIVVAGATTGRTLDVIVAGSAPQHPLDLLDSDRMGTVLAELRERYELVVLDSSPPTVVSDSIPLLRRVDGVLVVIRESKSTSGGTRRLRDELSHLGITVLGIVMNGVVHLDDSSDYGYYALAADGRAPSGSDDGAVRAPAPTGGGASDT